MTPAAPPTTPRPSPQRPSRSWPWALGALLVVALVWGGAYVAHRVVAARTLVAAHVPVPAYPPASLVSVLRPESGAPLSAPLGDTGRFVLLAGPYDQTCPPTGACPAAPPLDTLLVVDAATGATVAQASLTGAAVRPFALAVDASRGRADVISAHVVDVYATDSGAHLGTFALPLGAVADTSTSALVELDGTLMVTARIAGVPALVGMDATTGAPRSTVIWQTGSATITDGANPTGAAANPAGPTSTASAISGPVYDPATGLLALAVTTTSGGTDTTTLNIFDSTIGPPRATWALPPGGRLGPLDATSHTLYIFEPGGTTASITEAALTPTSSSSSRIAPPLAPLTPQPALAGAHALGWNAALGHIYLANAAGLRILDASGRTLETLPLPVAQLPDQPLATNESDGVVYVPTDHGALASVFDTHDNRGPARAQDLNTLTAALLARAAVAVLPPQNGQHPPFLTPSTFTVGPGNRSLDFYAFDADFGTNGPYPGTATLAVAAVLGQSNVYNATFTITWNLRFLHTRSWVYQVAANGAVRLVSQTGDGLPCCQTPGQTSG